MRHITLLALFIFTFGGVKAQIQDPVKWNYSVKRISDTEAELQMTATIEKGWHIYSINTPDTSAVIGTSVTFTKSASYQLIGKLKEPKPTEEFDKNFNESLRYHENKVTITQKVKVLSEKNFKIEGELTFMVCNSSMCLPPKYLDISFQLKGAPKASQAIIDENLKSDQTIKEEEEAENVKAEDVAPGVEPETEVIDYAYKGEDTTTYENGNTTAELDEQGEAPANRSLLGIFILSLLGGFAALLTPCVFPMIPLTVSFFTKQSKNRAKGIANAIIYGISIIILYTVIGFLITRIFGSDALNSFSTNPYVNIAFFILLIVFAISFFGAFEITLPSSWVNRTDRASDKGGILGIFFMAFTLALVSFSCTGPIIGTLLFDASRGGVQGPLVGMFGFSLALALPFALFAAFPGWLNSLPKSGGWLNSVKVVLGFIELAFAFKFLSNADLVWDANLLLREHFIAIWIAIFLLLTLYLLGRFRMPHDSPLDKISVPRLLLAIISLFFVVYLIPGMWGAPLKLISGFPPPSSYAESPGGLSSGNMVAAAVPSEIPDGANPNECPHHLNCFDDFKAGLAYAKKVDKPILLDFTGKACVNCRKMEEEVWSDPRVLEILRDKVVLISLFVDLRTPLPENEQYVSPVTGNKIRTIGNKWSEFQIKYFQTNSQPQYILLDHNSMKPLNGTTSYDPDIEKYINWLEQGISRFKKS